MRAALKEIRKGLVLWRGDITTLKCDAIVNAANRALLGCFCPNHGCIDNAIHTFAGMQLRLACRDIMLRQKHEEPAGMAQDDPRLQSAMPLCAAYRGAGCAGPRHAEGSGAAGLLLPRLPRSCGRSCPGQRGFLRISTGEFHFPRDLAARIAVQTVCGHEAVRHQRIRVIFNVFKEQDEALYRRILTAD